MMAVRTVAGLDIGTERVACVVGELNENDHLLITGAGQAPSSESVRDGVIVDLEGATEAVIQALAEAESLSSWAVREVAVSISGTHVRGFPGRGTVNVEPEDDYTPGEVTRAVVDKAVETAQLIKLPRESTVLSTVPCGYSIDGFERLPRPPVGLRAERLTADIYMLTADRTAVMNLEQVVRNSGRRVALVQAAASAGARAVLSRDEMEMGVLYADIGAGTTDVAMYHSGMLVHLAVIPVGGETITRDIQSMRIPRSDAEIIKRELVDVSATGTQGRKSLTVNTLGYRDKVPVTAEIVSEIAGRRVSELFDLIGSEMKQAGLKPADLPAGIVLTGGGSRLSGITGAASRSTGLPAVVGLPTGVEMSTALTATPEFSVAVGLVLMAVEEERNLSRRGRSSLLGDIADSVRGMFRKLK
jgi:cell division protein FtsA